MPIIDPIYTLILLIGLLYTARTRDVNWRALGASLGAFLISVSAFGSTTVAQACKRSCSLCATASDAGRVSCPHLAGYVMWRSIYVTNGRLYAEGLQIPWIGEAKVPTRWVNLTLDTFDDLPVALQANAEGTPPFQNLQVVCRRVSCADCGTVPNCQ
jgi:hypothetical protein